MTAENNPFEQFQATLIPAKQTEFKMFRNYYRKCRLSNETKYAFIKKLTPEDVIALWQRAQKWGVNLDGEQIWFDERLGLMTNWIGIRNMVFHRYPKARFDVQVVLEGDELTYGRTHNGVTYEFKKKNAFEELRLQFKLVKGQGVVLDGDTNLKGVFGVIATNDGTGTEAIEVITKEDLMQIIQSSRNVNNWNKWTGEMLIKTVFKRICKRVRFDDRFVQDWVDYDNTVNGNDFKNQEPEQVEDKEMEEALNNLIAKEQEQSS